MPLICTIVAKDMKDHQQYLRTLFIVRFIRQKRIEKTLISWGHERNEHSKDYPIMLTIIIASHKNFATVPSFDTRKQQQPGFHDALKARKCISFLQYGP